MRILVISDLPQFVTGGAEIQALRQIEYWLADGHEVIVLGRRIRSGSLDIDGHPVRLHRIPTLQSAGRALRGLSYLLSLSWLLLRLRRWPDVVHCVGLGDAAITLALLKWMRLVEIPTVAMLGIAGPHGDVGYIRSIPGHRWIVSLLKRYCDAAVVIAPQMHDDLQGLGLPKDRIVDIPVGVPLPVLGSTAVATASALRVVSVGRLAPQKGYDILAQALASLDAAFELEVEIIGDGPERDTLKTLFAGLPPARRIRWRGELGQAEISATLASSHLFLLPSRYEGMSNAALEAMAHGLPVLLTACGGIDRFIDDSMGWVAPVEDAAALARLISEAAATPAAELRQRGERCRQLVHERFEVGLISRKYLALFEALRRRRIR